MSEPDLAQHLTAADCHAREQELLPTDMKEQAYLPKQHAVCVFQNDKYLLYR